MGHFVKLPNKNIIFSHVLVVMSMVLLFAGCASKPIVRINAITDSNQTQSGSNYILLSGSSETPENDLYFQEFSRYFHHILATNGFNKVDDLSVANVRIMFSYDVSDGRTGMYSHSWPIYDTVGGYSYTITETSTDANGKQSVIKRKIHVPARLYRVGTEHETRSYTIYSHFAKLVAYDAANTDHQSTPIWSILLQSNNDSNDLRTIMPYLAAAAKNFIGKNSGRQVSLKIDSDSKIVKELQSLMPLATAFE